MSDRGQGFVLTKERAYQEGTTESIVKWCTVVRRLMLFDQTSQRT